MDQVHGDVGDPGVLGDSLATGSAFAKARRDKLCRRTEAWTAMGVGGRGLPPYSERDLS